MFDGAFKLYNAENLLSSTTVWISKKEKEIK